jgi:hypothetical protein
MSTAVFSAARASYSLVRQGNAGLVAQGDLILVLMSIGLVWLWIQFGSNRRTVTMYLQEREEKTSS